MYLKKITLLNFKNIVREELAFCAGVNCLVGDNGAGKTNVVDAVHYLSMCKSSLPTTDAQSIRHGEDFLLIDGQFHSDASRSETVVCTYSRKGGKVFKRNGKEYERLADHVGLIPSVIVSPADSALITEAADERRRYLNAFLSQIDRGYLATVMRYNAVLAERNRLLKNRPDEEMLQIYDRQLCEHGAAIHDRRRHYVAQLQPAAAEFYRILSGDREQVELHYKSELNDRSFEEVLRAAREKDLACEFTTSGIHRDDLVLRIGGYPLRKYGSQGQQKSFLIALKLAQYTVLAREKGEKPVLLLDDLFDKLDARRVEQLIRLVSDDAFGQIFITDCSSTRLKTILDKAGGDYALFTVIDGTVSHTRGPGSACAPAADPAGPTAAPIDAQDDPPTGNPSNTTTAAPTDKVDEPFDSATASPTDKADNPSDTTTASPTGNADELFDTTTISPTDKAGNPSDTTTSSPTGKADEPFDTTTASPTDKADYPSDTTAASAVGKADEPAGVSATPVDAADTLAPRTDDATGVTENTTTEQL